MIQSTKNTLRFFLNTQFIDSGSNIDLISIGVACENGNNYYAISNEFNPRNASDWVVENVLKLLPSIYIFGDEDYGNFLMSDPRWQPNIIKCDRLNTKERRQSFWRSRERIKLELVYFLKKGKYLESLRLKSYQKINIANINPDRPIEIWSYYAPYHWVAFCQLFGRMIDLPHGIPKHCFDLKQYADRLGDPRMPEYKLDAPLALNNAVECMKRYQWLSQLTTRLTPPAC